MATVNRYLDPDATGAGTGVDWTNAYNSMSAWEAAEATNLVTDGDIHILHCRASSGTADTTTLTLSGWTTGASNYIQIVTDVADRHGGLWDTSKYRLSGANADVLFIIEDYVRLEGMQMETSSRNNNGQSPVSWSLGVSNEQHLSYSILRTDDDNTYWAYTLSMNVTNMIGRVWNNYIHYMGTPHASGYSARFSGAATSYVYNNTFYGGGFGIRTTNTNTVIKNNIVDNASSSDYLGTWGTGSNYNASSDGTSSGGGNDRTSQTFSFTNVSLSDFRLQSGDTGAKDHGIDLSADVNLSFSDDIEGDTRSGTWDIGADEYVAGGTIYDMSASGEYGCEGTAGISSLKSVSADGEIGFEGAADVTSLISISGSGEFAYEGAADIVAIIGLSASGEIAVQGAASLAGIFGMSASGEFGVQGQAVLNAIKILQAVGEFGYQGTANLTFVVAQDGTLSRIFGAIDQYTITGVVDLLYISGAADISQIGGEVDY